MAASKRTGWEGREIGDLERAVVDYLADEADRGGIFVKSSRIAEELDISTHRAGQAIAKLREEWSTLEIDRWSGDAADQITWHVEHDGPTPYGVECGDCGTLVDDVGDECPSCGLEVGR